MKRPSRTSRLTTASLAVTAALAAAVSVAVVAPSAGASGNATACGSRSVGKPFSKYGDSNDYFLAPGGSFENGSAAWSLSNASVVTGNETNFLNASTDQRSLRVGGSATSPAFCISRAEPVLRFVARTATNSGSTGNYSQLNVSIVVRNAAGSAGTFFLGTIQPQGFGSWGVTQQFDYGKLLDSWLFGPNGSGAATMQVQLTNAGQGGTWYVDDVFVDPFCGR